MKSSGFLLMELIIALAIGLLAIILVGRGILCLMSSTEQIQVLNHAVRTPIAPTFEGLTTQASYEPVFVVWSGEGALTPLPALWKITTVTGKDKNPLFIHTAVQR